MTPTLSPPLSPCCRKPMDGGPVVFWCTGCGHDVHGSTVSREYPRPLPTVPGWETAHDDRLHYACPDCGAHAGLPCEPGCTNPSGERGRHSAAGWVR
jgi:hypothetical protein